MYDGWFFMTLKAAAVWVLIQAELECCFDIWRFILCAVSLFNNFKSFHTEAWTVAIREFCCATGTVEVQFIIFVAKKVKQKLLGGYKSHL